VKEGWRKKNAAEHDDSAASEVWPLLGRETVRAISVAAFEGLNRHPIFLPIAPLRKPRTEFGRQPVSFASSFKVTPPGAFQQAEDLVRFAAAVGGGGRLLLQGRGRGAPFGNTRLRRHSFVLILLLRGRHFVVLHLATVAA